MVPGGSARRWATGGVTGGSAGALATGGDAGGSTAAPGGNRRASDG